MLFVSFFSHLWFTVLLLNIFLSCPLVPFSNGKETNFISLATLKLLYIRETELSCKLKKGKLYFNSMYI